MDALGIYQRITKDFLDTSIDFENLFEKSAKVSSDERKAGNQLYFKKKHDQSIHKNILLHYSKSVAFAPNNSEELALAYSNRSALLLHLHQYQKCLVDVNRALQITQSNKLKCKLQARKEKCLNFLENVVANKNIEELTEDLSLQKSNKKKNERFSSVPKENDKALKLSSITPSTYIKSASEAVTAKYDEKYGRHLVATRYIKPGEIIVAERGYICFPIIRHRYLICSHCLSFAWNGIPCKNCAFALYCSESCREEAWEQYHDVECTLFQYISCMFYDDEDFVPDLIVAVRLFIIAVKREGIDTVINETKFQCNNLEALMVNGELRSDKFKSCINLHYYLQSKEENGINFNLSIVANALFEYTHFFDSKKDSNNDMTNKNLVHQLKSILKKLMGIVDVNSFKYQATTCNCQSFAQCSNSCESIRGVIIAPVSSLINHSCTSNVSRMFLPNGKVVMFTVAPINKGEQLFDSYGPSFAMEKEERQKHLQKVFNFTCECIPCKDNWPTDFELFNLNERIQDLIYPKMFLEFNATFPYASKTTIFSDDECKWQYDEETLKHAIKLSELTFKYFKDYTVATVQNLPWKHYIDKAHYELYGEKCVVPDKC